MRFRDGDEVVNGSGGQRPSEAVSTVDRRMPHWVVTLALAIAAWLVLAVAGGLIAGRALGGLSRLLRRRRRLV